MIILAGPYMGSFEQEILTFRPYVTWLLSELEYDNAYVNTHSNRIFLYKSLNKCDIIPVFENLSRDELSQNGYINTNVNQKNYNLISKNVKENLALKHDTNKKNVDQYILNYIMSTPIIPHHNKIFNSIIVPDVVNNYKNDIIFIPHISEEIEVLSRIKNFFKDSCVIVGDKRTYFEEDNVIRNMIDYYENGYKHIIKYISEAKAVVCPASFWTAICNLQGVPVFSWGDTISLYKEGGIYNFDNKNCVTSPTITNLEKMIEYFIEGLAL